MPRIQKPDHRPPLTLTRDQRMALIGEAVRWVERLDRLEDAVRRSQADFLRALVRSGMSPRHFDGDNILDDGFAQAHLLAVALRQIQRSLWMLSRAEWDGDLAHAGQAFIDHMEKEEIRFLRDLLEHYADYLAGKGDHQERVGRATPNVRFAVNEGALATIGVFEVDFEVRTAITMAQDLKATLEAHRASL